MEGFTTMFYFCNECTDGKGEIKLLRDGEQAKTWTRDQVIQNNTDLTNPTYTYPPPPLTQPPPLN